MLTPFKSRLPWKGVAAGSDCCTGPAFTLQSNLFGALSGKVDRSIDREWTIRSEIRQGEIDVVVHHARFTGLLIGDGNLSILNRQLSKRELLLVFGRSGLLCRCRSWKSSTSLARP